jgi:dihydroorotate dehydrogenase (fumarate)
MKNLASEYMGLELKNPLVVASCGLTKTLHGVQQAAEAGAGAIVLKSLFEEQISADIDELTHQSQHSGHTEAYDYLQGFGQALGPKNYLDLVSDAKATVSVPIIASVNCVTADRWTDYAAKLEDAGADALELNIGFLPNDPSISSVDVEERYFKILSAVRDKVKIPIAIKIGPYISSFSHFAEKIGNDRLAGPPFTVGWCGPGETENNIAWKAADALVLFNRFYRFDIDIEKRQIFGGNPYSTSEELHVSLRWISLLAGRVTCNLAATTGVHDGRDMIKQLLAGASVVQVCSTLYRNGLGQIGLILDQLEKWMNTYGFDNPADFRGQLSQINSQEPETYERLQYIKGLVGIE